MHFMHMINIDVTLINQLDLIRNKFLLTAINDGIELNPLKQLIIS